MLVIWVWFGVVRWFGFLVVGLRLWVELIWFGFATFCLCMIVAECGVCFNRCVLWFGLFELFKLMSFVFTVCYLLVGFFCFDACYMILSMSVAGLIDRR